MQLKRILVSLLVVIMMLSLTVVVASADEAVVLTTTSAATLDLAVGTTPTAEEGAISVKPGDKIDVTITIENNPGIIALSYRLKYNAEVLAPVTDADGKVVLESGILTYTDKGIVTNPGEIYLVSDLKNTTSVDATGTILTVSFTVIENAKCDSAIELADVKAYNASNAKVVTTATSVALDAHNYEVVETVAATCASEGYTLSKCSICNGEVTTAIPVSGHTYVETVVAPTCTAEGYTLNKCSVCGDEQKSDNVAALGHTEEVIAAVPGTCLANGTSEGKKCSVCGEILVAVTETTKGDHVLETYSEDGMTDGQKCSVCGEIVVPGEPISGSLLWLWIVIAVVVVAGAAAVVFFVVKKKK